MQSEVWRDHIVLEEALPIRFYLASSVVQLLYDLRAQFSLLSSSYRALLSLTASIWIQFNTTLLVL